MWELDELEAAAWADLYAAAPRPLARGMHLEHEQVDGASVFRARLPSPMFNRTLGVRALTEAILEATAPGAFLQIPPDVLRDADRLRLASRTFAPRSRWVKLTRAPGSAAPVRTPLRVVLAGPGQATAFGETLCAGLGLPALLAPWNAALVGRPGWRCYLALDGDLPVGTAALFARGGFAWLGAAGTIPAHRRRGAQSALIARRIEDATAAGAHLLISETGLPTSDAKNPSFDNLRAAGFTAAYERENFVRSG